MDKGLLLEELDVLKTYFEKMIDDMGKGGAELVTIAVLNSLKEYVEDAIKYVRGE